MATTCEFTHVQTGVIRLIQNTLRYTARQDWNAIAKDPGQSARLSALGRPPSASRASQAAGKGSIPRGGNPAIGLERVRAGPELRRRDQQDHPREDRAQHIRHESSRGALTLEQLERHAPVAPLIGQTPRLGKSHIPDAAYAVAVVGGNGRRCRATIARALLALKNKSARTIREIAKAGIEMASVQKRKFSAWTVFICASTSLPALAPITPLARVSSDFADDAAL